MYVTLFQSCTTTFGTSFPQKHNSISYCFSTEQRMYNYQSLGFIYLYNKTILDTLLSSTIVCL